MRRLGLSAVCLAVLAWMTATDCARGRSRRAAAGGAVAPASDTYKNVYDGWKWWHVYCYRCHGTNAVATTMAPDLHRPEPQDGAGRPS